MNRLDEILSRFNVGCIEKCDRLRQHQALARCNDEVLARYGLTCLEALSKAAEDRSCGGTMDVGERGPILECTVIGFSLGGAVANY